MSDNSDKGIIYLMTTAVKGLVKIGKTGSDNFEGRMQILENNGYYNTVGLKRSIAVEVEDYHQKEQMIHTLLEKSRVGASELFAVDIDLIKKLLLSFEGTLIHPKDRDKEQMFEKVASTKDLKETKLTSDTASKERRDHISYKLENMTPELSRVFNSITAYTQDIDSDRIIVVDSKVTRDFKVNKISFVSIYPLLKSREITLMFQLPPSEYVHSLENLQDMTGKGHWGAGSLKMKIAMNNKTQMKQAEEYIIKAYNQVNSKLMPTSSNLPKISKGSAEENKGS